VKLFRSLARPPEIGDLHFRNDTVIARTSLDDKYTAGYTACEVVSPDEFAESLADDLMALGFHANWKDKFVKVIKDGLRSMTPAERLEEDIRILTQEGYTREQQRTALGRVMTLAKKAVRS
jgi:hypothetical protein